MLCGSWPLVPHPVPFLSVPKIKETPGCQLSQKAFIPTTPELENVTRRVPFLQVPHFLATANGLASRADPLYWWTVLLPEHLGRKTLLLSEFS